MGSKTPFLLGVMMLAAGSVSAYEIFNTANSPNVDGTVNPYEYSLTAPLLGSDPDDGFGASNNMGELFATFTSDHLYIGLRYATLSVGNGMVIYINNPDVTTGWDNPAAGTDQGEPGDSGTPNHAESLLTRANSGGSYDLPGTSFADVGFALVDVGNDEFQTGNPSIRDNVGVYQFSAPNSGHNLGFVESSIAFDDEGGSAGGLEFRVPWAALGNPTANDTIHLAGFIVSNTGFVSNESLGHNLISGGNPGFGNITFDGGNVVSLTLTYVPEPSTAILLAFAMGFMMFVRRLRMGESVGFDFLGGLDDAFSATEKEVFAPARSGGTRTKHYKYRRSSAQAYRD